MQRAHAAPATTTIRVSRSARMLHSRQSPFGSHAAHACCTHNSARSYVMQCTHAAPPTAPIR
eukprot:294557-Chlamydomonas_euryale.AAC.1